MSAPARPKLKKALAAPGAAGVVFRLTGARPFVELPFDLTGDWDGTLLVPAVVKGAHVKVTVDISEENVPRFDPEAFARKLKEEHGAFHVRRVVPRVRKASAAARLPELADAPDDAARVRTFLTAAGLPDETRTRREALALSVLEEG